MSLKWCLDLAKARSQKKMWWDSEGRPPNPPWDLLENDGTGPRGDCRGLESGPTLPHPSTRASVISHWLCLGAPAFTVIRETW